MIYIIHVSTAPGWHKIIMVGEVVAVSLIYEDRMENMQSLLIKFL